MKTQAGRDILLEKGYKRHAWILLFVVGLFSLIFGLWFMRGIEPDPRYFKTVTGMTWDHFLAGDQGIVLYLTDSLRITGILLLGFGIYTMAISRTAFRKGERWAWYVAWYVPFNLVWTTLLLYSRGANSWVVPLHIGLLVITLLGLLLPYRRFFPVRSRNSVS